MLKRKSYRIITGVTGSTPASELKPKQKNQPMITKEIFYSVKCNRCGTVNEDGDDQSCFFDEGDAVESAINNDWAEIDNKHYCPDCFTYNDETDEYTEKAPYPDHLTKLKKFLEKVLNVRARVFEHPDSFIVKINIYSSKILIPIDERYVFEILGDHFISNEREDKRYGEVEYTVTIKK